MRRPGDLLRALLGLGATLALVFAVPAAMITFLGFTTPTQAEIDALPDPDATLAVMGAVGRVLLWAVWAQFAYSLVRELIAIVRAKPSPRLAVAGIVHSLMRQLAVVTARPISTIGQPNLLNGVAVQSLASLRTFPPVVDESAYVVASLAPADIVFDAEAHDDDDLQIDLREDEDDVVPQPEMPRAKGTYLTQRGDSWWAISEKLLGTGSRWREIRDLNHGVREDGDIINDRTEDVRPGWHLAVPADAESAYLINRSKRRRRRLKPVVEPREPLADAPSDVSASEDAVTDEQVADELVADESAPYAPIESAPQGSGDVFAEIANAIDDPSAPAGDGETVHPETFDAAVDRSAAMDDPIGPDQGPGPVEPVIDIVDEIDLRDAADIHAETVIDLRANRHETSHSSSFGVTMQAISHLNGDVVVESETEESTDQPTRGSTAEAATAAPVSPTRPTRRMRKAATESSTAEPTGRLAERFAQLGAERFAEVNGQLPSLRSSAEDPVKKGKRRGRRGGRR